MADPAEHPSGSLQTEADAVRGWIRYWVGVHDQEAALRSLDNALAAARREPLDVERLTELLDEHQFIDARGGQCTCDDWTGDPPERYHNDHVARRIRSSIPAREEE